MEKVVIGMSGGVDSSVAAFLLKEQGYEVIGVTMQMFRPDTPAQFKCIHTLKEDAKRVADQLEIEHVFLDMSEEFKKRVQDNFCEEYLRGRTPNPCVMCNHYIKWEYLMKEANKMGAEVIATGHYARKRFLDNGRCVLEAAASDKKDQTYALYQLTQEQLKNTIFPLGDLEKEKVREIADKEGLSVAHKADSMEICFIPDNDYAAYIQQNAVKTLPGKGNFVFTDGTVLGTHEGIIHYTIGQRKGLNLAMGHPVFVTQIRQETNEVVIGENEDVFSSKLYCSKLHLMAMENLEEPLRARVKIRYAHAGSMATIRPLPEGGAVCEFDEPVRAVTPGQSAVFYASDYVIGGGIIDSFSR